MIILVMLAAYVIGSIPMGFVVVKTLWRKDLRQVGSGRTGGTNAIRAAGLAAGLLTALLDILKGAAAVWLADSLLPEAQDALGMAVAGLCAILGHNYSVFLKFTGGPGGAPFIGGALAIWPWSMLFVMPVGLATLLASGHASVATLAVAVTVTALCAYRAYVQQAPAEFILYGVGAFALLAWALRAQIRRVLAGDEGLVGWRMRPTKQVGAGDAGRASE